MTQEAKNTNEFIIKPYTITDIISLLYNNKKLFLFITSFFVVIGIVTAFILPKKYSANATILPDNINSDNVSRISQIQRLTGLSIGGDSGIENVLPKIVNSRTMVAKMLASEYKDGIYLDEFKKYIKKDRKESEELYKKRLISIIIMDFRARMDNITGVVGVNFVARDAELVASALNEMLNQIDLYFRTSLNNNARNERQILEKRLLGVADSLKVFENDLINFEKRNVIKTDSPVLYAEYLRLRREVEIRTQIYSTLSTELELARVREVGSTPVINILDKAEVPILRSSPRRKEIVVLFGGLGIILSSIIILVRDNKKAVVNYLKAVTK